MERKEKTVRSPSGQAFCLPETEPAYAVGEPLAGGVGAPFGRLNSTISRACMGARCHGRLIPRDGAKGDWKEPPVTTGTHTITSKSSRQFPKFSEIEASVWLREDSDRCHRGSHASLGSKGNCALDRKAYSYLGAAAGAAGKRVNFGGSIRHDFRRAQCQERLFPVALDPTSWIQPPATLGTLSSLVETRHQ